MRMTASGSLKPEEMWGADMAYLSRSQLEDIASEIIRHYKEATVPEKHLCYSVDPTELASLLGFRVDYQYLTKDGSVLGKTASGRMWITVYDSDFSEILYDLDEQTILIEKRLLLSPRNIGRKNFTIAHELAHQIINRSFPGSYGIDNRVFCDYRRSVRPRKKVMDWHEWQADALAASMLLPPDAISDAMFIFGLGEKVKCLSRKYSQYNYDRFCEMAEYLQVSKTALAYRMEQLGLLERNLLVKEALARKGAA